MVATAYKRSHHYVSATLAMVALDAQDLLPGLWACPSVNLGIQDGGD